MFNIPITQPDLLYEIQAFVKSHPIVTPKPSPLAGTATPPPNAAAGWFRSPPNQQSPALCDFRRVRESFKMR